MPAFNRIFIILMLAATTAHAARPTLEQVTSRLSKAGGEWVFDRAINTERQPPDSIELQLRKQGSAIRIIATGAPSSLHEVFAIIGPLDADSADGKSLLSQGVKSLAAASDVPASEIQSWVLTHRDALRQGSFGKPAFRQGGRIHGNANKTSEGLEFWITVAWDEAKPAEPKGGLAGVEAFAKTASNWSSDAARAYKHSTGVQVTFDEDSLGPRMVLEFLPTDEAQANMGAAVWLLLANLGGSDELVRDNGERIQAWHRNPKPELKLHGASVKARDGEDGKVLITVRESP